jgi:glycosyltransferase involved in cell wall biosynthesis
MHQDRVDILLATYNGASFVDRQIESILDQMGAGCRLLIRDDGSTDGTFPLLRRWKSRRSNSIEILEDQNVNLGVCENFNRLLQHSDADYIVFCDQDDVWLPGHISKPLEQIKATEQVLGAATPVLAHTDLMVVDENLQTIAPSFWAYSNLNPYRGNVLNRLLVQNVVTGCATVINRALARLAFPIPPEALMHDWWLALVASVFGGIRAIPEKTVLYCQHSHNQLVGATEYNLKYLLRLSGEILSSGAPSQFFNKIHRQAVAFSRSFSLRLPSHHQAMLNAFINLSNDGFLERRLKLLNYGFLKSGLLRNMGWFAIV